MIKISQGTVTFKTPIRRFYNKFQLAMFRDVSFDTKEDKQGETSVENLLNAKNLAFEMLCDNIKIDDVVYHYKDIETLEEDGRFTMSDWNDCEDECVKILTGQDANTKKK